MDYGLRNICKNHDVILLDASAASLNFSAGMSYDELREASLRSGTRYHVDYKKKVNYINRMDGLLRGHRNIGTTELVYKELTEFSRRLQSGTSGIMLIKRSLDKLVHDLSSFDSVICFDDEEFQQKRIIAEEFAQLKLRYGLSEPDFDLIISSIILGGEGANLALISNDMELLKCYEHIKYIRSEIKSLLKAFTILGSEKILPRYTLFVNRSYN